MPCYFCLNKTSRWAVLLRGHNQKHYGSSVLVMKEKLGAKEVITFVEKSSQESYYPHLHNALDRQIRMLLVDGIGLERKKPEVITPEMEDLWNQSILGSYSLQALLKNFHLRGVQEHENMHFSQLKRMENPAQVHLLRMWFENHSGGLNDSITGKIVPNHGANCCHRWLKMPCSYLGPLRFESSSTVCQI